MKNNQCDCIIGKQSSYDETWEIKKSDFVKEYSLLSTNKTLTIHNFCYKCGEKIDKKKYNDLFTNLIVEVDDE